MMALIRNTKHINFERLALFSLKWLFWALFGALFSVLDDIYDWFGGFETVLLQFGGFECSRRRAEDPILLGLESCIRQTKWVS